MKNKKRVIEADSFTNREKGSLIDALKRFGYLLPTNEEELHEFKKAHGDSPVPVPEHLKSPDFLFKKSSQKKFKVASIQKQPVQIKFRNGNSQVLKPIAKNEYFMKIILAAEIANRLHEEATFGHIKLMKLFYLCNEVINLSLKLNIAKHAAGPLDGKLLHMIDAEFQNRNWFMVTTNSKYGYKYEPQSKLSEYKKYYLGYFEKYDESIQRLIELFRDKRSAFCELIATLYFVWKELKQFNEDSLIEGFYRWNESKQKFNKTSVLDGIKWMKEYGVYPSIA